MAELETMTAAGFEDAIAEGGAVLIDFWAEWCAPCRVLAPVLEELAPRFSDRLRFAKMNIERDEEKAVSDALGVRGIPTLILFKGGREAARFVGFLGSQTPERLVGFLEEHV